MPADTGRRRIVLSPTRDDYVDAGFVLVLMGLAIVGFRTTYSGSGYLIAGLVGTLLGIVIAHFANVLRQPMIAVAAATLVVFFLAGGAVALHASAIGGVLPSGSTFHLLSDESVHGWRKLLTTLPPVDGSGGLLVLPYLLGILGGVAGFCLARRARPSAAPVAAPFLVLAAVILLGTQTPAARLLQGAVFAVVALAWVAIRAARLRPPVQNGSGRATRLVTVVVLLGVAFGGAALIGPHVPGSGARARTVLRSYVDPPFDVGQYPSPLAGFRKYTKPAKELYAKDLFTIHGLPSGTLVRVATMDDYNGLTWTAANRPGGGDSPADTFQRVGTDIDDPAAGTHASYTVTIDSGYHDVWLPDAGSLTRLAFSGDRASGHGSSFRYNLATGTGVVPDGLQPGDSYAADAVLPATVALRAADQVATGAAVIAAGAFLHSQAVDWSRSGQGAAAQVLAIAKHLYQVGKFTDGEPPNQQYLPGHSEARLLTFVNGAQVAGDEEQFAATLALAADQLGIPARVVLGATLGASGVVTGKDVTAWVEVELTNGTWRAVLPDTFMNRNSHPDREPPQQQQQQAGQVVPPPARGRPHTGLLDATDAASKVKNTAQHHQVAHHGVAVPGWLVGLGTWGGPPVLLVVLVCAAIIGAKGLRRRRRRSRGTPATRLAQGWLELVDHARDLGAPAIAGRTRREQARDLAAHDLGQLATIADARVFGAAQPDDASAAEFWTHVDSARDRMSRSVSRGRRMLAALSLASLRRPAAGEPA